MSAPDTEKVSVNLGMVDLGQVDLLVEQGFYTNRTDFIRTAVRNHLQTHSAVVQQQMTLRDMSIGVTVYTRAALEKLKKKEKAVDLRVIGVLTIADDVSPELALETIRSVKVFGMLQASDDVKRVLSSRIEE